MPLEAVDDRRVVIDHLIACLLLWSLRPLHELIPVSTLHYLIIANSVLDFRDWHRCIIGFAHYVLSDGIKTTIDVSGTDCLL